MESFEQIVKRISNDFIKEARQSPNLLSDISKMEYYMAESYGGRSFVELLQNADDAQSTKVLVLHKNGTIYFANNGRDFNEKDLIAISRSGASEKKRGETIGYRGIGFKSISSISEDIIIYSSGTFFSFSKRLCAQILMMDPDNVPTIRVPLFVDNIPKTIQLTVEHLEKEGYSTVFILRNPHEELFSEELDCVDEGYFLFLKHIKECLFQKSESKKPNSAFIINRESINNKCYVTVISNYEKKEWMLIKGEGATIAFLLDKGVIIPCPDSEAVYHCYLPTLDKAMISCKINADFSTDPSRKHLTVDEKTKDALRSVALLFKNVLKSALNEEETKTYKNILNMFLKRSTISKANYYLDDILQQGLTTGKWIVLNNGLCCSPIEYKLFSNFYEIDDIPNIRSKHGPLFEMSLSPHIYSNVDLVDEFMAQYSRAQFEIDEIIAALSDIDFVSKLNQESYIQLMASAIREAKISCGFNRNVTSIIGRILIITETNEYISIDVLKNNSSLKIKKIIQKEILERLGASEIQWLETVTGIQINAHSSEIINTKSETEIKETISFSKESLSPFITKWRDAESKCLEIESLMGNEAEDVSLRNVGYDLVSTTPEGIKKYIEVKSVKKDFSFSLTNNEYTSAYEYGDSYYVYLLCENENTLDVRIIRNPLKNAKFEKRIRQWEWACLEFNAFEFSYELS